MLPKQPNLRTSPDLLLTPRQHPSLSTYSSQSLSTLTTKLSYKDNPYGTSPNLKFVDPTSPPPKQITNPSKNTSNQKSPLFFKHSEYRIGQKSPRTARVSEMEQQNRLSFKKSFKSITKKNQGGIKSNLSIERKGSGYQGGSQLERQQNREKDRLNEKQQGVLAVQEELIISLKEIKRLREVIQNLSRDNKKLKRIAHEILEGKFQDPVNISGVTSQQQQNLKSITNSQINTFLNASLLSLPNTNNVIHNSLNTPSLQSLKQQNLQLTSQLSKLSHQLSLKSLQISHLQSLLSQQKHLTFQLQQQSKTIKTQYIHSRNRVLQLQSKITKLQKSNLNLSNLRGNNMAESRDVLQNELMDLSDQYSIVEEKIINNFEQREKEGGGGILQGLLREHEGREQGDFEMLKGLSGKEKERDNDSIMTKESQSVVQSNIMNVSLKRENQYERVGELMRLGSRRE